MIQLPRWTGRAVVQAILIFWLLFLLLPMLIILSLSVRTAADTYASLLIPQSVVWDNYVTAWREGDFGLLYRNSAIVTGVSLVMTLAFSALAAFAFGRRRFRGRTALYILLLAGFFMPWHVGVIPLFLNLRVLGLLNTYWSLILPYVAFTLPLAILILTSFFQEIPNELEDAAKIDGCTDLQLFWYVMLPIARPALSAVAVLLFLTYWNEFMFAITLVFDADHATVPAGIHQFTGSQREFLGPVSAAVVLSSIPVLMFYFAFQNTFIQGVTVGALKE